MKKILIDSGPLIALFDASDKYHNKVANFIKSNEHPLLVTTIASITETLHKAYTSKYKLKIQTLGSHAVSKW